MSKSALYKAMTQSGTGPLGIRIEDWRGSFAVFWRTSPTKELTFTKTGLEERE